MEGTFNPQHRQKIDRASYGMYKLAHSFWGLMRSRDVNK
jgi:hypothetical protein